MDWITFLGSSVIVALLSGVFAWFQGRKRDSLDYITEERRKWRKRIRDIAEQIQQCEYNKKDNGKMNFYLVQLQMNINTYGVISRADYAQDGHIWNIIEKIQLSCDKNEFKKNKELLLYYISLMLKEDWERSKREVKGYGKGQLAIAVLGIFIALYAIYYFYILHIEETFVFILTVVITVIVVYCFQKFSIDGIENIISKKRKLLTLKENTIIWIGLCFKFGSVILLYLIFIILIAFSFIKVFPNKVIDNMMYYHDEKNEVLYINTGFKDQFFGDLDIDIEENIQKEVRLSNRTENMKRLKNIRSEEYVIIKNIVEKNIIVINKYFIFLFWFLPMGISCIFPSNMNRNRLYNKVEKLQYFLFGQAKIDLQQAKIILQELLNMEDTIKNKRFKNLIGLEWKLLKNIKSDLDRRIIGAKEAMNTMEDYNEWEKTCRNREIIDECIKNIKIVNRKTNIEKTKKVIEGIKHKLEKVLY